MNPSSGHFWSLLKLGVVALCCSGLSLARVPLGEPVPNSLRGGITGAYWLVFYSRSCLEPMLLEQHWQRLRDSKLGVVAVNPIEVGNVAQAAPRDFAALSGPQALALSRSLKVGTYPTTVLVDQTNLTRLAFEGPISAEEVRKALNLLPSSP